MRRDSGLWRHLVLATALSVALSGCSLFNQVPASLDPIDGEAAGGGAAQPQAAPKPLKPTVRWRKCGKPFECAKVRVPLDHDKPRRGSVELALIRLKAPSAKTRVGSLIVNPGGPGGSGVDFVRHGGVETIPAELRARFDIVGFDPRGVGKSNPVSCGAEPSRFLGQDMVPDAAAEVATILVGAQRLAAACAAASRNMLPHMSTAAVARDLDRIRRAVGDRQLTYLGYSYGSFIGTTYAELFPTKVRAMVLDGPVDPALNGYQRARDQAAVLERTLKTFFKECRRERECKRLAAGLTLKRFDGLIEQLNRQPLPATKLGHGRQLRSAEALLATALLLKEKGPGWQLLAAGLGMALDGDGSLLLAVADSSTGKTAAASQQEWLAPLLAVNCLDVPVPDPSEYAASAAELTKESAHFGGLMLLLSSACSYWHEPPQRRARPADAPKAPPIVVVGTTGDPTTPYEWATALASQLPSAALVTRDGASHTSFGGQNVCTDRHVIRYLSKLLVPPVGAGCR